MKQNKWIVPVLITLSIIGIIFSYILTYEHYIDPVLKNYKAELNTLSKMTRTVCGSDKSFINCSKVAESKFSSFAGTPIAVYGLFFFILLFSLFTILNFVHDKLKETYLIILFLLTALGSIIDLILLIISIFSIKALCTLCIVTYLSLWSILIIIIVYLKKNKLFTLRQVSKLKEFVSTTNNHKLKDIGIISIIVIITTGISYGSNYYLINEKERVTKQVQAETLDKIVRDFNKTRKKKIELGENHNIFTIGDFNAPITIVEYSDFMCPACSRVTKILDEFVRENSQKVRIIFVNFPLDKKCNSIMKRQLHEGACLLAKGSICAAQQGKFIDYYKKAFSKKYHIATSNNVETLAVEAGLNKIIFKSCLSSNNTERTLKNQIDSAIKVNVNSTPTIYINNREYRYKPNKEILKNIIEEELKEIDKRMFFKKYNK